MNIPTLPPAKYDKPPTCTLTNRKDGHWYKTPGGATYPSITTILGATRDKSGLEAWRERVGEGVADYISQQATTTGTLVHAEVESMLKHEKYTGEATLLSSAHAEQIRHKLIATRAYYTEFRMHSTRLKCAGTADCIGQFRGFLTVLDFKTAKKHKKREWITDYFLQGAAYAIMYQELTGSLPPYIAIIISAEDRTCTVYRELTEQYIKPLEARIAQYYKRQSI